MEKRDRLTLIGGAPHELKVGDLGYLNIRLTPTEKEKGVGYLGLPQKTQYRIVEILDTMLPEIKVTTIHSLSCHTIPVAYFNKISYVGCGKLGYCAYATEEYVKSELDSKGFEIVCLQFYEPIYSNHLAMERSVKWKGRPYNTHVLLYNFENGRWIDPLYNEKFDDYKHYFQFF